MLEAVKEKDRLVHANADLAEQIKELEKVNTESLTEMSAMKSDGIKLRDQFQEFKKNEKQ